MSRRADAGRSHLDHLDAQTAVHHLETAADEARQAGHRVGDIARRELQHGWNRLDRGMEESTFLEAGPHGSPLELTQWDALKHVASTAAQNGVHDLQVVRSRLQPLPEAICDPYPTSSTADLDKGVRLHGQFSQRYLGYAAKDAGEALRQAGMAGRYAFEVGRRTLVHEGGPEKPRVFKNHPCSPSDPLRALADEQDRERRVATGLMTAAGVAGDVALGYAWERWERRRRARRTREGTTP